MNKNIYVAGCWNRRSDLKILMDEMRTTGFNITSNWPTRENGDRSAQSLQRDAYEDCKEVEMSDCVLAVMNDPKYAYRGTFTEIGYALGLNKNVVIVCPNTNPEAKENFYYCTTNVFFHYPTIKHFPTVEQALEYLRKF